MSAVFEIDTSKEIQKTLAIIKPDITRTGKEDDLLTRFVEAGLTILVQKRQRLSDDQVDFLHQSLIAEPYYLQLKKFLTSEDSIILVLASVDAVNLLKTLAGDEDPATAKKLDAQSIRAQYGTSKIENAIHVSNNRALSRREIAYFFPMIRVDPLVDRNEINAFVDDRLTPTLVKALTALSKTKPAEPVKWLANYLLENNPNQPKVEEPEAIIENY